jgi:hypothetical protein
MLEYTPQELVTIKWVNNVVLPTRHHMKHNGQAKSDLPLPVMPRDRRDRTAYFRLCSTNGRLNHRPEDDSGIQGALIASNYEL